MTAAYWKQAREKIKVDGKVATVPVKNVFYHEEIDGSKRYMVLAAVGSRKYRRYTDANGDAITGLKSAKDVAHDYVKSVRKTGGTTGENSKRVFLDLIAELMQKGRIEKTESKNSSNGHRYTSPNPGIEDQCIFQLVSYFGKYRLGAITPELIKKFADAKLTEGVKPVSARRYLNSLNNIFIEAKSADFTTLNPVTDFRQQYEKYFSRQTAPQKTSVQQEKYDARTRVLSVDRWSLHKLACWQEWNATKRPAALLWLTMAYTAQRPKELRLLLTHDVLLADAHPHFCIRPENQKSRYYRRKGITRRVYLDNDLLPILKVYHPTGKTYFSVSPENLKTAWRHITARVADITTSIGMPAPKDRYTPYALRHTMINRMVEGTTVGRLGRLACHLGHTRAELINTYIVDDNSDIYDRTAALENITPLQKTLTSVALAALKEMVAAGAPMGAVNELIPESQKEGIWGKNRTNIGQ